MSVWIPFVVFFFLTKIKRKIETEVSQLPNFIFASARETWTLWNVDWRAGHVPVQFWIKAGVNELQTSGLVGVLLQHLGQTSSLAWASIGWYRSTITITVAIGSFSGIVRELHCNSVFGSNYIVYLHYNLIIDIHQEIPII